jgi:hypothetical protein
VSNGWSKLTIHNKVKKKTLIFILLGANQNLGQFETVIRSNIPSFNSTPIFKMLKTLWQNFSLTRNFIKTVSPTQSLTAPTLACQVMKPMLPTRRTGRRVDQVDPP